MGYRKHDPSVYVVRWPDGVVKVGYTDSKRWRKFTLRGARLLKVLFFSTADDAIHAEQMMARTIKYPRAFTSAKASLEHIGSGGGGWTECYAVPNTVASADILRPMLTAVPCSEHCYTGIKAEHAKHRCTDRQTDRLTYRVVKLDLDIALSYAREETA